MKRRYFGENLFTELAFDSAAPADPASNEDEEHEAAMQVAVKAGLDAYKAARDKRRRAGKDSTAATSGQPSENRSELFDRARDSAADHALDSAPETTFDEMFHTAHTKRYPQHRTRND